MDQTVALPRVLVVNCCILILLSGNCGTWLQGEPIGYPMSDVNVSDKGNYNEFKSVNDNNKMIMADNETDNDRNDIDGDRQTVILKGNYTIIDPYRGKLIY